MKKVNLICILLFFCNLCFSQKEKEINYAGDCDSIQSIINTMYYLISGDAGQRDWERFNNLFTEDASINALVFDEKGKPRYLKGKVEDYIKGVDNYFIQNGFYEKEIGRKVLRYSTLATVFSTFESKLKEKGPVYQRGINCLQLIFIDNRWYIANLIYNTEKKSEPINDEFLNLD